MDIDKLLGKMPGIRFLGWHFLKSLEPGAAVMKRPTTTMENLEEMLLLSVGFYDLVETQYVLLLIKSSPNLQYLDIDVEHKVQSGNGMDLLNPMVLSEHMILGQLKTLIIHDMVGSRAEFHFIKLLLAYSLSLRRIELKMDTIVVDPTEKLKILLEVLQALEHPKLHRSNGSSGLVAGKTCL